MTHSTCSGFTASLRFEQQDVLKEWKAHCGEPRPDTGPKLGNLPGLPPGRALARLTGR